MNAPEHACALALDVGGTNIRMASVSQSGQIIARQQYKNSFSRMHAPSGDHARSKVLRILTSAMNSMLASHSCIHSIGIGFPGFFNQQTGILTSSPNISGLIDFPLAKKLSETLSLPVYVQNDAVLATLGEFRFGAGKTLKNLLHLTLGTGVGSGLILNGIPYIGESGMAMEMGHLRVTTNGRSCGCGGSGCLETCASASGVTARYNETGPGKVTNAKDVHHRALDGDMQAVQILQEAGRYLGQALAEAVKLLDVHNISISGGLSGAWEFLSEPMKTSLDEHLIPPLKGKINLHRSRLGDDAGLLGAAVLALEAGIIKSVSPQSTR